MSDALPDRPSPASIGASALLACFAGFVTLGAVGDARGHLLAAVGPLGFLVAAVARPPQRRVIAWLRPLCVGVPALALAFAGEPVALGVAWLGPLSAPVSLALLWLHLANGFFAREPETSREIFLTSLALIGLGLWSDLLVLWPWHAGVLLALLTARGLLASRRDLPPGPAWGMAVALACVSVILATGGFAAGGLVSEWGRRPEAPRRQGLEQVVSRPVLVGPLDDHKRGTASAPPERRPPERMSSLLDTPAKVVLGGRDEGVPAGRPRPGRPVRVVLDVASPEAVAHVHSWESGERPRHSVSTTVVVASLEERDGWTVLPDTPADPSRRGPPSDVLNYRVVVVPFLKDASLSPPPVVSIPPPVPPPSPPRSLPRPKVRAPDDLRWRLPASASSFSGAWASRSSPPGRGAGSPGGVGRDPSTGASTGGTRLGSMVDIQQGPSSRMSPLDGRYRAPAPDPARLIRTPQRARAGAGGDGGASGGGGGGSGGGGGGRCAGGRCTGASPAGATVRSGTCKPPTGRAPRRRFFDLTPPLDRGRSGLGGSEFRLLADPELGPPGSWPVGETVLLRVRASHSDYFRVAIHGDFDGRRWQSLQSPRHPIPGRLPPSMAVFEQTVRIESWSDPRIPSAYAPARVEGPVEATLLPGLTLGLSEVPSRGQVFKVHSTPDAPVDTRLESDPSDFLGLPPVISPRVSKLAGDLAPGGSPLEIAGAVAGHLGQTCEYVMSYPALDGADRLDQFLFQTRKGNCQVFATAGALLLRRRGVPTRLVSGFSGGDLDPVTGELQLKTKHAHAWCEVYLVGRGWCTFDPTPPAHSRARRERMERVLEPRTWSSLGKASAADSGPAEASPAAPRPDPAPAHVAGAPPAPPVRRSEQALAMVRRTVIDRIEGARRRVLPAIPAEGSHGATWPWLVGLVAAGILTGGLARRARRAARRPGSEPRPQSVEAYDVLLQRLARWGLSRHPWETPHEYLQRVHAQVGEVRALDDLTEIYVKARFGVTPQVDPAGQESRALASLALAAIEEQLSRIARSDTGKVGSTPPEGLEPR